VRTLTELMRAKGLYARCPNCEESFPLRRAQLYDATKPLPDYAVEQLNAGKSELSDARGQLRAERKRLEKRSFTSAATSGVGQRLEMLTASLPGLPVAAADCRTLLKPIDYLAFSGASKGRVESVHFIEVKTGENRLSRIQRAIREAVVRGAVSIRVANHELPGEKP
jgi:predicted Holliday junction resolvase-like endonuclease